MRRTCTTWLTSLSGLLTFVLVVSTSSQAADKGRIVFVSDRTTSWQIYTMNPDGTDQVQLTNLAPTDDDLLTPSISRDGKQIVFNYNAGEGPDLYLMNSDGSDLHSLTSDHLSFGAHWSPDGKTIVYGNISELGTVVIATIAAYGAGQKKTLTTKRWESVFPIYTPDGRHIVFGSQMGGLVSAVWIMNADGSHQRRLTPAALKAQSWAVSPDGKKIAGYFNQNTPPALKNNLFTMNLDGSNRKVLAPGRGFHHDLYPTYSPDGKKISFASDRFSGDITELTYGSFGVLTMNSNGADIKEIVPAAGLCPHDGNCVDPSWGASPMD